MVWLAALLWTVGYCWLRGYPHAEGSWLVQLGLAARQPEVFPLRCALPNWVFWGIFIPWLACTAFTAVLSFFLPDDSLDS